MSVGKECVSEGLNLWVLECAGLDELPFAGLCSSSLEGAVCPDNRCIYSAVKILFFHQSRN